MFPVSTDAPIYHYPIATGGLIVANLVVFVDAALGWGATEQYWLQLGSGLHPVQWLTHMFHHLGVLHLLGNMLFLWCFGLVVEGKLGWWKFLPLYLLIGGAAGAGLQVVALHGEPGYALGASAAIFGIVVIAGAWAPKNEVHMVGFIYYRPFFWDVPVAIVALWYVIWDVLAVVVFGIDMISATGHLLGAAIGGALGLMLLVFKWVDCEGYDVLSILSGREGGDAADPQVMRQQHEQLRKENKRQRRLAKNVIGESRPQILVFLQHGNASAAMKLFDKLRSLDRQLTWDAEELRYLIRHFLQHEQWDQAIYYMEEFLARFPEGAELMRLQLANTELVHKGRPAKSLRILNDIGVDNLSPEERGIYASLLENAQRELAGM